MAITIEEYRYEEIYPAFKAGTDEKEVTARLNRAFLNHLGDADAVVTGGEPIDVADIGCGPCDTLIKYLTGVRFEPGFRVCATDYNVAYADEHRGEVLKNLGEAKSGNALKLVDFSVRAGDAFEGRLRDLLRVSAAPDRRGPFRIVFISHMLYHCGNQGEVQRLIEDVADNLLSDNGICILYHLARTPKTFQDFRARYGSNSALVAHSNTPAVAIDDPPTTIAQICATRGIPCASLDFSANLHFGALDDRDWADFGRPAEYAQLCARKPGAAEDLRRLMFVSQRAPIEFASDRSATGLEAFLTEIRSVLEHGNGVLKLAEKMQVIHRTDASAKIGDAVASALATVSRGLSL